MQHGHGPRLTPGRESATLTSVPLPERLLQAFLGPRGVRAPKVSRGSGCCLGGSCFCVHLGLGRQEETRTGHRTKAAATTENFGG